MTPDSREGDVSGAAQQCPDCGSPLTPCKCEDRENYLVKPGDVWNSTLGVRKGSGLTTRTRLKSRTLSEKYGEDALRYGPLFQVVRELKCAGHPDVYLIPGHRCGPGYAPASAHHLDSKQHLDARGLIPCCGRLHDQLEQFPGEIQWADDWTTERVGRFYVVHARNTLRHRGDLTEEIENAVREAA